MNPNSPRRSRTPRGPVPAAYHSFSLSPPALLSVAAAYPMYTQHRPSANSFVPDAQILFHVLGICDQMMNSTHRFVRSSPAWLPIVSQLYISILWNVTILINSNCFMNVQFLNDLINNRRITECMIPGPLIPFFQSLAALNAPSHYIGTIMPDFPTLWNSAQFHPNPDYARQIPIPAIILDQLHYFSQCPIPANQTSSCTNFEWYRNVFCQGVGTYNPHNRIGPQLCGSLFTSQSQFDAALTFWNSALSSGISRANANNTDRTFTNLAQLFGFQSQTGSVQLNWFQQTAQVMHNYARYFNQSAPLKSILQVQNGAVAVRGVPTANAATRDWLYPNLSDIDPFTSARFPARREIPDEMAVVFQHADYELDEDSERYAIVAHTNIQWAPTLVEQNSWTGIAGNRLHQGDYWGVMPHRFTGPVRLKVSFANVIASRYHQHDLD